MDYDDVRRLLLGCRLERSELADSNLGLAGPEISTMSFERPWRRLWSLTSRRYETMMKASVANATVTANNVICRIIDSATGAVHGKKVITENALKRIRAQCRKRLKRIWGENWEGVERFTQFRWFRLRKRVKSITERQYPIVLTASRWVWCACPKLDTVSEQSKDPLSCSKHRLIRSALVKKAFRFECNGYRSGKNNGSSSIRHVLHTIG